MLALARSHAAYFRDYLLAPEREASLVAVASGSLAEAEALASSDTRPFGAYLQDQLGSG
jgi:hypothetical protein